MSTIPTGQRGDVQKQWDPNQQEYENYNVDPPVLTEDELFERSFDLNKLFAISQVRESPHPQFDGMGYMKWNETNEMADISYLVPKKNKFDTRVTSGITHEKDTSIVSLLQGFNFETNVTIFYKDQELPELSTSCTEWIKKSRELDHYDEKRPIHYRNLIVQGTAFADVKHICNYVPNKVVTSKGESYTGPEGIKWKDMGLKKHFEGVSVNMVDGKKVFMEDFHQNDIRKQVGIYTVEYIPREIIKSIWQDNPRWKNVPVKQAPNGTIGAMITQGSIYSDWFFLTLDFDKCEVIQAIRQFENRYQIYINGIPMLPAGFPLSEISPSGLAHLAKGDIDPMNMCAYSKGIPAKTKMDQALYDAFLRIAKIKFEQSAFPPTGNLSGRTLSPDIFMPTKITRNLRKEDLSILTDNQGLVPADFEMLKMIKEQIDNKSITSILENGQPNNEMTLGQYLDSQKRQLLKLGGIFDGVINWEKQISHLMLMDCLYHSDYDTENIPLKQTFEDGTKGLRILRMKQKYDMKNSDELHQEENDYKEETGQDVRYHDLNPEQLKAMVNNPDYYFYYEIIPTDKNNDKISQAFFISMITQAANLFGMQSMKVQNLKQKFAKMFGCQFDDLFLNDQEMQMQQQQQNPQQDDEQAEGEGGAPNANRTGAPGIGLPNPGNAKVASMYK